MIKLVIHLLSALVVVSSLGCASAPPKNEILKSQWTGSLVSGLFTTRDKPLLREFKGEMYQVRYSAQDLLMIRNLQSGKEALVAGLPVGANRAALSSYSDEQNIYVAWRNRLAVDGKDGVGKIGDKSIYIARSNDGVVFDAPQLLSTSNGAFTPILAGNKTGAVYAVWQDERDGGNYDLYFNVSNDHGATWKKKDMRLDVGDVNASFSAEPFLRAEGDNVWVTWVEAGKDICAVFVRHSANRGENWSPAVEIAQCGSKQFLYPQLAISNGKLHAYWYHSTDVKRSTSNDWGKTWGPVSTVIETEGPETLLHELVIAEDAAGSVHLLYGKRGGAKFSRTNLYYMKANDGESFSRSVRLNSGVEYSDSAILANIAFDNKNNPMVAWTDYRFFRSTVVGTYSADQGKTWTNDFLLSAETDKGTSQFPHLATVNGDWWVSMVSYVGPNATSMLQGVTQVSRVDPKERALDAVSSHAAVDTSKLEQRVKAWWDTRLKEDWAGSYDLMDPFMRAKNSKKGYISSQGLVQYYGYEVVGFEMTGPRQASVKVKYTSEMPELEINNKKYSVPKKEVEITQDWIFVDGNWYFLFKDLFGGNFREL